MRTLGEWYRDNVLNRTDWVEVDLPSGKGEIRLEQQLYSWLLYQGKKYIECETEEEARYLKVFLEARQPFIKMPRDREYVKKILPDLEWLKGRIDEIIEEHTDGILNESKRERIIDLAWYKLMKEGYEAEEKLEETERLNSQPEEAEVDE